VAKGRGELSCQSQPGEGTSFLITFPMKEAEA
jgi:two-component system, CitB family, sensor histidine kinase DctS